MLYKTDLCFKEYDEVPRRLWQIAEDFEKLSLMFKIEPLITRILEKVEGSSGVHQFNRAIDFRDEHAGKRLYTDAQASALCKMINLAYPRGDKYTVLMNHSFGGGPKHFHMQIPAEWV